MTEALLIVLLLGSMYLTARLYPKPPRYVPIGKSEVYFLPVIVDLKSFNNALTDIKDALRMTYVSYKEFNDEFEKLKKWYEEEVDWQ